MLLKAKIRTLFSLMMFHIRNSFFDKNATMTDNAIAKNFRCLSNEKLHAKFITIMHCLNIRTNTTSSRSVKLRLMNLMNLAGTHLLNALWRHDSTIDSQSSFIFGTMLANQVCCCRPCFQHLPQHGVSHLIKEGGS